MLALCQKFNLLNEKEKIFDTEDVFNLEDLKQYY